jgi:guanosine-3',5'-bis(diphosphate) 3'-pyrophosphohydrolase
MFSQIRSMEETLKKIIEFADQAHAEQMRKYTPERYIVHPVRVMEMCREYTDDLPLLAAAILHDVLEDTPVTAKDLHVFLETLMTTEEADRTVKLVKELTDEFVKSAYPHLNRRKRKAMETERLIKTSPDSQTIKYADIYDNCKEIVTHDPHFAKVFLSECKNILKHLDKGNPLLWEQAKEMVEKGITLLKVNKKRSSQTPE